MLKLQKGIVKTGHNLDMTTPEEKFNSDLWYVLQKIKKQSLYTVYKQDIKYSIVQGFFGTPFNDDEQAIVEKLNEWNAITLEEQNGSLSVIKNGSRIFNIKEINQKFRQLYLLYENALTKQVNSQRLFQLTQEVAKPIGRDDLLNFEIWELTQKKDGENKERTLKSLTRRELSNIQLIYKLSTENRSRVKRLIEIIQNQMELTGYESSFFGKDPLKIPIEALQREGYSVSEAELLIDNIDRTADRNFIKVITLDQVARTTLSHFTEKDTEKVLRIEIQSKPTLQDIKKHIEEFEKNLAKSLEKSEPKNKNIENNKKVSKQIIINSVDEIYYNNKTGTGEINGKAFKIKPRDKSYEVFSSLYGTINNPLSRLDVLVNSRFYQEGESPDPARSSAETLHINEIAKSIRRILNIDTTKLINNDGNLTLIGKRIKFPKTNQTEPK